MRFSLPVLSAAQVLVAQNPEIGVDSVVLASPVEVVKLGTIMLDALGVATWYPKAGASFGAGLDVHLRLESEILADAAPTVELNVTLVGVEPPTTALATLAVPSWVADQNHIYPVGHALDFVPQGTGNGSKLVTAITGVHAVTNAPASAEFSVWGSFAASNFIEIGYKRGTEGEYNVPASVAIADGYNPAAAIKKGRPDVPELNLEFAHISAMGGMTRYNGHRTSVWVKILKDKAVHSGNVVYVGCRLHSTPKRGGGNDEVVETAKGPYENVLLFDAY